MGDRPGRGPPVRSRRAGPCRARSHAGPRSAPRLLPAMSVGWATMIDFDEVLAANSNRFREVLAGVPAATRVPSCPDWAADDLLWHLTEVQSFWLTIVDQGLQTDEEVGAVTAPGRPVDRDAAIALVREGVLPAGHEARRRRRRRPGVDVDAEPHGRVGPSPAGAGGADASRGCRADGRAAQRDRPGARRGRRRRAADAVRLGAAGVGCVRSLRDARRGPQCADRSFLAGPPRALPRGRPVRTGPRRARLPAGEPSPGGPRGCGPRGLAADLLLWLWGRADGAGISATGEQSARAALREAIVANTQ